MDAKATADEIIAQEEEKMKSAIGQTYTQSNAKPWCSITTGELLERIREYRQMMIEQTATAWLPVFLQDAANKPKEFGQKSLFIIDERLTGNDVKVHVSKDVMDAMKRLAGMPTLDQTDAGRKEKS